MMVQRDDSAAAPAALRAELGYHIDRTGTDALLSLHGELDLASAGRLDDAAQAAADCGGIALLVDLQALTFLDAAGGRALLEWYEIVQREHTSVTFTGVRSAVWKVLSLTGLDHLLPVEGDGSGEFTARARALSHS